MGTLEVIPEGTMDFIAFCSLIFYTETLRKQFTLYWLTFNKHQCSLYSKIEVNDKVKSLTLKWHSLMALVKN